MNEQRPPNSLIVNFNKQSEHKLSVYTELYMPYSQHLI